MLRIGYAGCGFVGPLAKKLASALLADGPLRAFYSIVPLALALIMA